MAPTPFRKQDETPTLRLNLDLEEIAARIGAIVQNRKTLRLPAAVRADFEWWLQHQGLTGRLSIDYSQGKAGWLIWEETR